MTDPQEKIPQSILVVEDDQDQCAQLEKLLCEAGYYIYTAADLTAAGEILEKKEIDLVLLDLRLGQEKGIEILKSVKRQKPDFPVVILSSISYNTQKVSALELGADDYVTKPYHQPELVLRIKRLLRHNNENNGSIVRTIAIGNAELELQNGILRRDSKRFFLRRKILDLLIYLYHNADQVVSRDQITEQIWNGELDGENVISVSIHELRKALEENPRKPQLLLTIKGFGYMLRPDHPVNAHASSGA